MCRLRMGFFSTVRRYEIQAAHPQPKMIAFDLSRSLWRGRTSLLKRRKSETLIVDGKTLKSSVPVVTPTAGEKSKGITHVTEVAARHQMHPSERG